jgi:single-stranded-DNA-specific exonuclease
LYARGFDSAEKFDRCFKSSLKELRCPSTLLGMDRAVERLIEAFKSQEPVCIYADFDLDGSSGLALLKTGLESLGFSKVIGYQPRRLAEGYGVHAAAVREIAEAGVRLMVTVDVGITAHEALLEAKRLGMDVIVTDHHLPKETLPEALTIVNPNQGTCTSGLGHLAGVGVAFYLFLAVRRALRESGLAYSETDPKELLDFFVIGTVTDMVPLIRENRVLVKHGLVQLSQTKRPGLRALIEVLGLDGRLLDSSDVGMKFAPKLNALSRLESNIRPIDMLLENDLKKARDLAREVLACNDRRVETQKRGLEIALAQLQAAKPRSCVWVWSREFHRGVVGLIATRLSQETGMPAFVGSLGDDGRIVGSARAPKNAAANLVAALETASAQLERFGGHAHAAGFELEQTKVEDFRSSLESHFANAPQDSIEPVWYDAEGSFSEVDDNLMKWLDQIGPFGSGFEAPVFRFRDMRVKKVSELRGGHLRFDFLRAGGPAVSGIFFSPPRDAARLVCGDGAKTLEVLGELQWNHFQGRKSPQLQLRDLRSL